MSASPVDSIYKIFPESIFSISFLVEVHIQAAVKQYNNLFFLIFVFAHIHFLFLFFKCCTAPFSFHLFLDFCLLLFYLLKKRRNICGLFLFCFSVYHLKLPKFVICKQAEG